ncbi:MAG: hypothetical protein CMM87_06275 [Rickettsiales bacterium]|nr:hypothetical protein [Rickettsiales bacterium]|tara:strand:+ start:63282 stop:64526 length:1245 start_codon:yes stop_codon:yes gene_type:complete
MALLKLYDLCMHIIHPFLHLVAPLFYNKESSNQRLSRSFPLKRSGSYVWVHGASLGELKTLEPLLKSISKNTTLNLIITSSSKRSFDGIVAFAKKYGDHQFIPFDVPAFRQHFLNYWQPKLVIWTESDLWPGFLNEIKKNNIPLYLINGKLSQRSKKRWRHISKTFQKMMGCFTKIYAQSQKDQEAYNDLEINSAEYMGNIKFLQGVTAEKNQKLNLCIPSDKLSWLASCTHSGEEEILINVHKKILIKHPNTLLIIAPRHPHRAQEVAELCQKVNLSYQFYSKNDQIESNVLIFDVFGNLSELYKKMHFSFLGGSFINKGGHNPIEALTNHCKLIVGPHHQGNHSLYEPFIDKPFINIAFTEGDLFKLVLEELENKDDRNKFFEESDQIINTEQKKAQYLVKEMTNIIKKINQ